MTVRVRFAPSPTGYLHVGGARTALFNWLFARKEKGTFILRIEDTDVARSSDEMVQGILDALMWLGLEWDEGPYYQSQRLEIYRDHAHRLLQEGKAYPCFCSPELLEQERKQSQAEGKPYRYDRRCLKLSAEEKESKLKAGEPFAIRFLIPENRGAIHFHDIVQGSLSFQADEIEDFVLLRSDGHPTYQLAVVVDDHDMGVTHVIRGADHISNTPKQILLYEAFGWPIPSFAHVPLILGPDKKRLSKRHGAVSVLQYREDGFLPEALLNHLILLGWYPPDGKEILTVDEMLARFQLEDINKANPVFDIKKLDWLNHEYLAHMDAHKIFTYLKPFLDEAGVLSRAESNLEHTLRCIDLLKTRMHRLTDFVRLGEAFFTDAYHFEMKAVKKRWKYEDVPTWLQELSIRFEKISEFTLESIEHTVRSYAEEKGIKPAHVIHAIRIALTGRSVGPGLFELMEVLGKNKVVERLSRASSFAREYLKNGDLPAHIKLEEGP